MFEDNFLMLEPSPLYLQACLELSKTAALSGCKLEELGNDYRMYWSFLESSLCPLTSAVPKDSHINDCLLIFDSRSASERTDTQLTQSLCTGFESLYLPHNRLDWGADTPGPLPFRWRTLRWHEGRTEYQLSTVVIGNTHFLGSFLVPPPQSSSCVLSS